MSDLSGQSEVAIRNPALGGFRPLGGFRLVIPGKVASKKNSKQLFVRGGAPRMVSSKAYRIWEKAALLALARQWNGREALSGLLCVSLNVWLGSRQRLDLDNAIQGPLDVLTKARVIEDDRLVQELSARKLVDKDDPRVEIWVRPL